MNSEQEKVLEQLIKENNVQDNTENIKNAKNSNKIRKDVAIIQNLKLQNNSKDFEKLNREAIVQCSFLNTNYPNIYQKLLKDEINIEILYNFLDELEYIETGKQTQHEASYNIGMLLKSLYIDKELHNIDTKKQKKNIKKITYSEYLKRSKSLP